MKPTTLLSLFLAALAGGAVGGILARPTTAPAPLVAAPAPGLSPATSLDGRSADAVRRDLDDLRLALAGLERKLEALERAPAPLPVQPAAPEPEALTSAQLTSKQEHQVFELIEADRARRATERAVARELKRIEGIENYAAAMTTKLGLAPGSEDFLTAVLLEESQRQIEIKDAGMNWNDPNDQRAMKESFAQVREWRTAQFTQHFGPDMARRMASMEGGDKK